MSRPAYTATAQGHATRLRNQLTISEATLWTCIRRNRLGVRFRRQVPIGHWIADFASFAPKLVIEVDDPSHTFRDEERRSAYIRGRGFVIVRYTNAEVATELDSVVEHLRSRIDELTHPPGE